MALFTVVTQVSALGQPSSIVRIPRKNLHPGVFTRLMEISGCEYGEYTKGEHTHAWVTATSEVAKLCSYLSTFADEDALLAKVKELRKEFPATVEEVSVEEVPTQAPEVIYPLPAKPATAEASGKPADNESPLDIIPIELD